MKNRIVLALVFASVATPLFGAEGQIRICRTPRIQEIMDGKKVSIPDGATFTGTCDKHGERCRNITILAESGGTVGPKKTDCLVLLATLTQEDGNPLAVGDQLLPQFNTPGFSPTITVTKGFK